MGVSCNARFVILEDGLFGAIPYMMREDYCLDYCQRIVLNIRRIAIASTFYQKSNIRSLSYSLLPVLKDQNFGYAEVFQHDLQYQ